MPTGTIAPTSTPAPTATPVTEQAYQDEFKRYMDSIKPRLRSMTEADWRKLVEADLLQQKLYEDVTKDVPTTGEQVRLRHILIAIRTPRADAGADRDAWCGRHRRADCCA